MLIHSNHRGQMKPHSVLALSACLWVAGCSGAKQAELAELKDTNDALNSRVTTSLGERNVLVSKVGTIKSESLTFANTDVAAEIAEIEEQVQTLEKKRHASTASRDEAATILETLKSRSKQ